MYHVDNVDVIFLSYTLGSETERSEMLDLWIFFVRLKDNLGICETASRRYRTQTMCHFVEVSTQCSFYDLKVVCV